MKLRDVFTSWDIWVAVALATAELFVFPSTILNKSLTNFYYITCTVAAILFSFYLTGFAIIVSSPADEFLQFAEKKKIFTQLLGFFKFTLWLLLFVLVVSIMGYCASSYLADIGGVTSCQPTYIFITYSFIFWYGLFAAASSIQSTVAFAQYRNIFLTHKRKPVAPSENAQSPS